MHHSPFERFVGHPRPASAGGALTSALLGCALLYGVTYVIANDVVAASLQAHYSRLGQAVSELSAVGSPSAGFLTAMLPLFAALTVCFATGIWRASGGRVSLRVASGLTFGSAVVGVAWLWFPMTARADMEAGPMAANDVGHLVLSALTVSLILLRMGFGAAAFGASFRAFTALCAVVLLGFGAWMGAMVPDVSLGEPLPWMGLVERVMLGAWLAWDATFAVALLRRVRRAPYSVARNQKFAEPRGRYA